MVVLIFLVILGLTFENLTRVTEDPLPLGNSTIQILIFRPVPSYKPRREPVAAENLLGKNEQGERCSVSL